MFPSGRLLPATIAALAIAFVVRGATLVASVSGVGRQDGDASATLNVIGEARAATAVPQPVRPAPSAPAASARSVLPASGNSLHPGSGDPPPLTSDQDAVAGANVPVSGTGASPARVSASVNQPSPIARASQPPSQTGLALKGPLGSSLASSVPGATNPLDGASKGPDLRISTSSLEDRAIPASRPSPSPPPVASTSASTTTPVQPAASTAASNPAAAAPSPSRDRQAAPNASALPPEAVQLRRSQLEEREQQIKDREASSEATEKRLSERVAELVALQTRLQALQSALQERDEANWAGLVKLYEGMRPRDAAVIFNSLDEPVLLEFLDRMKPAKAGPILAVMEPERARQATSDLAAKRTHSTSLTH